MDSGNDVLIGRLPEINQTKIIVRKGDKYYVEDTSLDSKSKASSFFRRKIDFFWIHFILLLV